MHSFLVACSLSPSSLRIARTSTTSTSLLAERSGARTVRSWGPSTAAPAGTARRSATDAMPDGDDWEDDMETEPNFTGRLRSLPVSPLHCGGRVHHEMVMDPIRRAEEMTPGELWWRNEHQIAGRYYRCNLCGQDSLLPVSKMEAE